MGTRIKIYFPKDRYELVHESGELGVSYPTLYIGGEEFRVDSVHNYGKGDVDVTFVINGSEIEIVEERENE